MKLSDGTTCLAHAQQHHGYDADMKDTRRVSALLTLLAVQNADTSLPHCLLYLYSDLY